MGAAFSGRRTCEFLVPASIKLPFNNGWFHVVARFFPIPLREPQCLDFPRQRLSDTLDRTLPPQQVEEVVILGRRWHFV